MEGNIELLQDELDEALADLQRTVADVNEKVETVGSNLKPDHLVRRHLLPAAGVAACAGLAAGTRKGRLATIATLLAGAFLGAILFEAHHGSSADGNP